VAEKLSRRLGCIRRPGLKRDGAFHRGISDVDLVLSDIFGRNVHHAGGDVLPAVSQNMDQLPRETR
jgi:hypothetical protein